MAVIYFDGTPLAPRQSGQESPTQLESLLPASKYLSKKSPRWFRIWPTSLRSPFICSMSVVLTAPLVVGRAAAPEMAEAMSLVEVAEATWDLVLAAWVVEGEL